MRLFFLFFVSIIFFSGCENKFNHYIRDNISEVREFVLYGKNEVLSATFSCGEREIEYKMDGVATDLIPFGILTITLVDDTHVLEYDFSYVLFVGMERYEGALTRNPYDNTLVVDIGKKIDKSHNVCVEIYYNNEKQSLKLKTIDDGWIIDSDDVVEIFVDKYEKEIKTFVVDKKFCGEVYIKIIDDYDKYGSDFYYYINLVGTQGSNLCMLISPKTGEILSSSCVLN